MAENEEHGLDYDGVQVCMGGIVTAAKGKITRKGAMMGFFTLEDLTGQMEALVFPKVYERYASFINTDAMIIAEGKLSFREEEEPKLLVDSVRPLNAQTAGVKPRNIKEAKSELQNQVSSVQKAREERLKAVQEASAPKLTDAQLAKQAAHKLYLLIPNRAEMEHVKNISIFYYGDVPVYAKLQDEGIALLLSRDFWCDGSTEVLEEFRALYGNEGVVMK